MITIKNLSKSFGKAKILDKISLSVKKGEVLGFLGPNGAGKTTTLKTIIGLVRTTSGEIQINNIDSKNIQSHQHLGYMPEDPYFYEYLTGREFLIFVAELQKIVKTEARKQAGELLKLVGLGGEVKKYIRDYSKGMRQRLGIAQALVGDPEILLLDEPLDGLDPIGRAEVKNILLDLKKQGKTILLSSHILADIEELCDRVVIINKGKIIKTGKIGDFTGRGKTLEKVFVELIKKVAR